MSELPQPDRDPQLLRSQTGEWVAERLGWIREAVDVIGGPEARPEDVFPLPPPVRRDAPTPDWSDSQITVVRNTAHRLGYGSETNVPTGLVGGVRIIDAGLAWKYATEVEALKEEIQPKAIIFAGSPDRLLTDDEQDFLSNNYRSLLGGESATEYGLAEFYARRLANRYAGKPAELNYGYQVAPGHPFVQNPTGNLAGQLVHIGHSENAQTVGLLRADRENYIDETGEAKFRNRPFPQDLVRFISQVLSAKGNRDWPIGLMTSNAYAENVVRVVSEGIDLNREVGVGMYGRLPFAEVKGIPLQPDTPLNQLPGALRMYSDQLIALQEKLELAA